MFVVVVDRIRPAYRCNDVMTGNRSVALTILASPSRRFLRAAQEHLGRSQVESAPILAEVVSAEPTTRACLLLVGADRTLR